MGLRQQFRDSDYVVRWGGEEFLAVSRFVDRAEAPAVAERVRQAVAGHTIEIDAGTVLSMTCSIGFAPFPVAAGTSDGPGWEQVLDLAHAGLYAAKRSGRNAWVGLTAGPAWREEQTTSLPDDAAAAIADCTEPS